MGGDEDKNDGGIESVLSEDECFGVDSFAQQHAINATPLIKGGHRHLHHYLVSYGYA